MKCNNWTPNSAHSALRTALATATLLSLTIAPTFAEPSATNVAPSSSGVYVSILSPNPGTSLTGLKQIEITAYYESGFGVSSLDLFIDGRRMATQRLSAPENRGEISFLVQSNALAEGAHSFVVRATATDEEVASAKTSLNMPGAAEDNTDVQSADTPNSDNAPTPNVPGAPTVEIVNPIGEASVSGVVKIKVNSSDVSGKSPYVSLFIDDAFKTLRNFPPYIFDWDTTRLTNGFHTIKVWAYNDSDLVGHADPIRVFVNNPSGRTFERHDLSDLSDTPTAAFKTSPKAFISRKSAPVAKAASQPRNVRPLGTPLIATTSLFLKSDATKPLALESFKSSLSSLDDANVDAGLISPTASELKVAGIVRRSETTDHAPGQPMIATDNSGFVTVPTAMSTKLEKIAPIDDDYDSGTVSTTINAPPVKLAPVNLQRPVTLHNHSAFAPGSPLLVSSDTTKPQIKTVGKLVQMASANVDDSSVVAEPSQLTTPNIEAIKDNAVREIREIVRHTVDIGDLSKLDKHVLTGTRQVVFDNQRVVLDRPLQDKDSILFAPFRQIFESQGGRLLWDNVKQEVHAVSPTRDIVVTVGSRLATINNAMIPMSAAPYLFLNRTMLPLDFFPMAMNVNVSFDATTGHLVITSK